MRALHGTRQLRGLLGTSSFMRLPRKCLRQKKMVEVFPKVGLLFPPSFECYFPLSRAKRPTSPCHNCSSSLASGFRSPAGRGESPQEQFWLMGTHVKPSGRLFPDPISTAEPRGTPAVGHVMTSSVWVPLDITHLEADWSLGEMILQHPLRLLVHQ